MCPIFTPSTTHPLPTTNLPTLQSIFVLLDNEDCVQIVVLENTILTKLPVTKDSLEMANDTTYTTLHHDTANVDIICVVPRHSVSTRVVAN